MDLLLVLVAFLWIRSCILKHFIDFIDSHFSITALYNIVFYAMSAFAIIFSPIIEVDSPSTRIVLSTFWKEDTSSLLFV